MWPFLNSSGGESLRPSSHRVVVGWLTTSTALGPLLFCKESFPIAQKFQKQLTTFGGRGLVSSSLGLNPGSGKEQKQMPEADSMLPVTMCTASPSSVDDLSRCLRKDGDNHSWGHCISGLRRPELRL